MIELQLEIDKKNNTSKQDAPQYVAQKGQCGDAPQRPTIKGAVF